MQTQAYTHFEYDWIFLLFSSLHVAKSHEWNILIWFLTRGLCLVFFVVGDIVLHVFSIIQVQARDLGGTSGMTGLSIILLSDYFTFFFFFASIGKTTFIILLTYKIMAESMSLKGKTKNPLLNKINCKQTWGNPLKSPTKRFTSPCGK